jgi:N-acetylglucosamine kinase-like BadF-type ATPase
MHSDPPPPDAHSRLRAAGEGVQLLSLAWVGVEAGIFDLIAAQASTPAQIAAARGQAESIRIINEAVAANPRYVELKAVEKWDGKLPTVTGGAMPMLQLPGSKQPE